MKKIGFLLGATVLVLSLLLTGCGVAQGEYDAVVAELDAAQSQIATLESDYDTLTQKVAKAKLYGEILENYYFVPTFEMTTAETLELSSMIDDTGDAELKEKWTTYIDNLTNESYVAFWIAAWDALWEALY